jgi:hypothetical protein
MVEVGVDVVRQSDKLCQWFGGVRRNVFGDIAIDGPLPVILLSREVGIVQLSGPESDDGMLHPQIPKWWNLPILCCDSSRQV